jgi:hypothetical protein
MLAYDATALFTGGYSGDIGSSLRHFLGNLYGKARRTEMLQQVRLYFITADIL